MSPTICPSATSKSTPSSATIPPKRTVRVRTARMVGTRSAAAGVGAEAPLPEVLFLAHVLTDPAAEHEEEVAQAVEVAQRPLGGRLHARERQQLALGPPAHGTRLVQESLDAAPAGQDEGLERRQVLLAAVHDVLELRHLALADPEHALVDRVGGRRQLAAEVEELVLHLLERRVEPGVTLAAGAARRQPLRVEDADQADHGVELVHGAVGDDAWRVLGYSPAADQRGLALVAEARVHARDADGHSSASLPAGRYST